MDRLTSVEGTTTGSRSEVGVDDDWARLPVPRCFTPVIGEMERWKGHVAIVTGATAGIGKCIAEDLLRAGMIVVGVARRAELLTKIAEVANARRPGSYHPIACDLAVEADILKVFEYIRKNFKTVHVLVNNAAVLFSENVIDGSTDHFRKILDVNVLAVAICIREASKLMREHGVQGHIINVNSIAGHEASRVRAPVSLYSASKYALTGMTQSIRNELNSLDCGIKISSISPGPVKTDMICTLEFVEDFLQHTRILDAQDVSDAVLYALGTSPHVQINELKITPLDETMQNASSFAK